MRSFRRRLAPLLGTSTRRRLRVSSAGAALLAVLDAVGVALVLPLVQLVTTLDDPGPLPSPANLLADFLGTTTRSSTAVVLAVAVLIAFASKSAAAVVLLRYSTNTCLAAEADMADRLMRRYLAAPLAFHLRRNSAELQTTLQESLRRIYQDGLATSIPAVADRLVLVAIGLSLVVMAPLETVVGGISLAVIAGAYRQVARRRSRASSEGVLRQVRRSYQLTQQALSSIREIKVTGTEDHFAQALHRVRQVHMERQAVLTLTEQLPRYYLELGIVTATGAVGAVSFLVRSPTDALAVLGVFLAGGLRVLPSLNRVLIASGKAEAALPHLDQVVADLTLTDTEPMDKVGTGELSSPIKHVHVAAVHYEYEPGRPVLKGLDFEVRAGEMVALVGSSGAGKTTAVSILLGLADPTAGQVVVDGAPLDRCRRSWQRRLGYVPQDVVLFDAPIRENVAFGEDSPDESEVWRALRAASLDELVRSMPDGLDTVVGEGGSRLSGGQRQRLGLARCFYRRPEVLLLDESTSALDTETESRVLDTLDEARGDAIVIVVAHRLSTVRRCDRIVVLKDGAAEAVGTFDQLLVSSPTFRELASPGPRTREATSPEP